jgi:hypothetical protein
MSFYTRKSKFTVTGVCPRNIKIFYLLKRKYQESVYMADPCQGSTRRLTMNSFMAQSSLSLLTLCCSDCKFVEGHLVGDRLDKHITLEETTIA